MNFNEQTKEDIDRAFKALEILDEISNIIGTRWYTRETYKYRSIVMLLIRNGILKEEKE